MNSPTQIPDSAPTTASWQGFKSNPLTYAERNDPVVFGMALRQAITRFLRSKTRVGRLLNRLEGIKPPRLPLRLVESKDQSDP
jgi:hypothetical protein